MILVVSLLILFNLGRLFLTMIAMKHCPGPAQVVCLFSQISILILCVDVKISGQPSPAQPRQYKQWRSILILSNYIRSLREREGRQQHNTTFTLPARPTDINIQYQPQPST